MKKNIETIVKFLIYATFFVPLVIMPSSFIFPFIVPKILLFRSLVMIMLGGYMLLLIINWNEYRPRFSWVSLALSFFLTSFAISTFVGADPYHSFWDNHERMLGLFTVAHYVAFYFVASAVFKKWEDWLWALRVFLGAGSVVMFIGVIQIFNPTFLLNGGGDRIASTLGNSVYVGGYGLFLTFVATLLFIKESSKAWRYGALVGGIMALVGLFFSGSRGALLGVLMGGIVAIILYSFLLKEHAKVRKGIWLTGGVCIILGVVLFLNRGSEFINRVPAIDRLLNTSYTEVKNSARFIAWEVAVTSWKEKPIFGWGPNNFFYAFNKNYNPRSLNFGYGETWFDNAHNILVNTLAVQGIVGLVTYLFIFGASFKVLVSAYRRKNIDLHLAIIGGAFLIAHLVQSVTVFENPTSYLYFMFWLAMISRLATNNLQSPNTIYTADKKIGWGAVVGMGAVVSMIIFIFNIQPARANQKTLQALRVISSGKISIDDLRVVISFSSPHIDDIRTDIGRATSNVAASYQKNVTAENKDQLNALLGFAFEVVEPNLQLHPLDIRTYMMLAQFSQTKAIVNNDVEALKQAEDYLTKAVALSPKRQQVLFILAQTKLQLGKNDEAIKILEDILVLNDQIGEPYWRLGYAYGLIGKLGKAQEMLNLVSERKIRLTDQDKNIITELQGQLDASRPATSTSTTTPKKK